MSEPMISISDMNARGWTIWVQAYELGATEGWGRGYGAAEEDFAELHRRAHAIVQHVARHPKRPWWRRNDGSDK